MRNATEVGQAPCFDFLDRLFGDPFARPAEGAFVVAFFADVAAFAGARVAGFASIALGFVRGAFCGDVFFTGRFFDPAFGGSFSLTFSVTA